MIIDYFSLALFTVICRIEAIRLLVALVLYYQQQHQLFCRYSSGTAAPYLYGELQPLYLQRQGG